MPSRSAALTATAVLPTPAIPEIASRAMTAGGERSAWPAPDPAVPVTAAQSRCISVRRPTREVCRGRFRGAVGAGSSCRRPARGVRDQLGQRGPAQNLLMNPGQLLAGIGTEILAQPAPRVLIDP